VLGAGIKKILRSRLPQRVRGVPPVLVELAIGIVVPVMMLLLRMSLHSFAGDRAPYAFMFVGAALATLLAGWRSGVLAVAVGQTLAWYYILHPTYSFALPDPEVRGALVIATIAQLLTVLIVALYQREVDKGTAERERRLALLDEALREIDHRTRNNYQTVLAMIGLQARRTSDPGTRDALRQVGDRIEAIASASAQLAARSADLGSVKLDDHLCDLVRQIGRGLSREEIQVDCDVDDVTASADKAVSIGIIVNELVTNAIKHAFNGERAGVVRVTGRNASGFELVVADDGCGMASGRRSDRNGLGTRLVESFAKQLGAKHEILSSESGTTHRIFIPSLA
jgi:two-component sensor histidine kinase